MSNKNVKDLKVGDVFYYVVNGLPVEENTVKEILYSKIMKDSFIIVENGFYLAKQLKDNDLYQIIK